MKTMEKYIFTKTSSGDRTNIMATFPLWTKNMFLKDVKNSQDRGRYRYGKLGEYISLLKDMRLEEFNEVFSKEDFTDSELKLLFRKEISENFLEKVTIKALPKKDIVRGYVYEDLSGYKWLHYGKVRRTVTVSGKEKFVEEGFGFTQVYQEPVEPKHYATILKTVKKFKSKDDSFTRVDFKESYVLEGKDWMGHKRIETLEIL